MTNKKAVAFNITELQIQSLEELARDLDCKWGDKGNISQLLRKIAEGEIIVVKKEEFENIQTTNSLKLAKEAVFNIKLNLINYINQNLKL